MVKWIIAAILLLPLMEIAVFVLVAALVGFGWAVALLLLTTLAGSLVLRHAGRRKIALFRVAVTDNDVTGIQANTGGFLTVLAGFLLFVPGFLTDLLGAALLIGPIRRAVGQAFHGWLRRRQTDPSVIDLPPSEWRKEPDRELPGHSSRLG